jgi:phosphatidate cytidylyltransferase
VLKQRVITAVVLLAVLVAAAAAGRQTLNGAIAVAIGAAAFEWLRLAQHSTQVSLIGAILIAAALFVLDFVAGWPRATSLAVLLVLAGCTWLLISALVLRGALHGARVAQWLSTLMCVVLLAAAWSALQQLMTSGPVYLLSVLVVVWLADIAAYFAGRRWGRRKLAPGISPGKTWAGVGGAVAAVLAVAVLFAYLAPDIQLFSTLLQQRLPLFAAMGILAALVALSIVGDLFESLLKRQVGAKDSGKLLPGHGGVLDRIDALVAVLPVAALLDLWLRA